MAERIIDISEGSAGLSVRHRQLVIQRDGQETQLPIEEIGALIV